jgi:hypothetical protein
MPLVDIRFIGTVMPFSVHTFLQKIYFEVTRAFSLFRSKAWRSGQNRRTQESQIRSLPRTDAPVQVQCDGFKRMACLDKDGRWRNLFSRQCLERVLGVVPVRFSRAPVFCAGLPLVLTQSRTDTKPRFGGSHYKIMVDICCYCRQMGDAVPVLDSSSLSRRGNLK